MDVTPPAYGYVWLIRRYPWHLKLSGIIKAASSKNIVHHNSCSPDPCLAFCPDYPKRGVGGTRALALLLFIYLVIYLFIHIGYLFMYTRVYIYIYIHLHVHIHIHMHIHIHIRKHMLNYTEIVHITMTCNVF